MRFDFSDYKAIIYVDATNGDDTQGDGSENKPFATVIKASAVATVDKTAIFIKEGTYHFPLGLSEIFNTSVEITYVTETIDDYRKKVIFDLQSVDNRNPVMLKLNTFIGIIFRRSGTKEKRVWEYVRNAARLDLVFYNCVFDKGEVTPTSFPIFTGNSGAGCAITRLDYINCAFTPPSLIGLNATTGIYRGDFSNCAIASPKLTNTPSNLLSAVFDEDYHVLNSTDDVGVYKGINAWILIEKRLLISYLNNFYYYNTNQWDTIPVPVTQDKILNLGMESIDSSQVEEFEALYGRTWTPIYWTDGKLARKGILNATPHAQVLTAKNSIQLTGIVGATFKWTATGDARIALSVDDGVTYRAYRNGAWLNVTNNMSNAMTDSEYSALTWNQYELLSGDSNFLKHQYYIPDQSTVDDILIECELMGTNKVADSSAFDLSYNLDTQTIRYSLKSNGTYFANILDV